MSLFNRSRNNAVRCLAVAGLTTSVVSLPVLADVWVFDPSVSLDQRLDDNYYLIADADGNLAATRAVGELGISRESQSASYRGLARIDALLTTTNDNGEEGLDSNQYLAFDANLRSARSRYGVLTSFKQDTPSRDIAADLSDADNLSSDTGLDLTQNSNVARQEYIIEPNFEYDLTRRLIFDANATLTKVDHDLPSAQDAIYQQYITAFPRLEDGSFDGVPLSYSDVTIDDAGKPFTPSGELDDYVENEIDLGFRFKYSTITTLSATASYSHYTADVEPNAFAVIPFEDLIADPTNKDILRKPRREAISTTATFKLGYERSLTPTLKVAVDGGVYTNTTDETDTLRVGVDRPLDEIPQELLDSLESDTDGWLASVSLNYDAGLTRYALRYAVDVEPSSSGSQVETNELTGDLYRVISPRLNFSLRGRAYEPDRLGVNQDDEYARRFISIEPKIEWKAARDWTVSAAYRYRRQKARIAAASAESNAILLSLKYTLPSKVRDEAAANGL